MPLPSVAVILPTFNEEGSIDACMRSLADQDYPGRWEIVVADGRSEDATRARIETWHARTNLRIVDNPARVQSAGLWAAAQATDADVLVRADAHTVYSPDYLSRSVEVLADSGATAAGGPMVPDAFSRFGTAVARVMRSPVGVGPGAFHHVGRRREVDTVYLGAFLRSDFLELGGMRTFPSGVAEDADFYWRMRRAGGSVILDPGIGSVYRPRETWRGLWTQFRRYGMGKADMLLVNRAWPSWRPLAPLALIAGLLGGVALGVFGVWWPLGLLSVAWLAVLTVAGRGRPLDMVVAATMHLAYGIGLLGGLMRSPARVRAQVSAASSP